MQREYLVQASIVALGASPVLLLAAYLFL